MRRSSFRRFILFLVPVLLLTACGPPRLDPSSKEALEESLAEIREELQGEARQSFDDALTYLTGDTPFAADPSTWKTTLAAYAGLTDMTAGEIISLAWNRRVWALEAEAKELEALRAASVDDRKLLDGLQLGEIRMFKPGGGFLDAPLIEVTVTNQTGLWLTSVEFRATLSRPGAVPELVVDEQIEHPIFTPFGDGIQERWRIECTSKAWQEALASCGSCSFRLEAVGLRGRDGVSLASSSFNSHEQARLHQVQDRLAKLQEAGPPAGADPGAGN